MVFSHLMSISNLYFSSYFPLLTTRLMTLASVVGVDHSSDDYIRAGCSSSAE
jgi:hypothetical protein